MASTSAAGARKRPRESRRQPVRYLGDEPEEIDSDLVQPPEDPRDHAILQFHPDSPESKKLEKLLPMPLLQPRTIDWELMGELGARERLEAMFTPRWRQLLGTAGEQYQELTLEFLSSYHHSPSLFSTDHAVSFCLGRRQFHFSVPQFAVRTGLYSAEEVTEPAFLDSIRGVDDVDDPRVVSHAQLRDFWATIGDQVFQSSLPASYIRDPVIRFLHRIIACTVVGRSMGIEKVNQIDLLVLFCMMTGREPNLACILLSSLDRPRKRGRDARLSMGPYITMLARHLDVFPRYPEAGMHRGPLSTPVRYEDLQQMGVCPWDAPRRFLPVREVHLAQPPPGVDPEEVPQVGVPPPRQPRPAAAERSTGPPPATDIPSSSAPPPEDDSRMARLEAGQVELRQEVSQIRDTQSEILSTLQQILARLPPPPPQ